MASGVSRRARVRGPTDVVEVGREGRPPGVGDDNVDAAQRLLGTLDDLGNALARKRVALDDRVSLAREPLERALGALLVARVVEGEADAALGEEARHEGADAAGPAGDECALALEVDHSVG
jgi:hypothetical protein